VVTHTVCGGATSVMFGGGANFNGLGELSPPSPHLSSPLIDHCLCQITGSAATGCEIKIKCHRAVD